MSTSGVEPGAQGAEIIDKLKDKQGDSPGEIFQRAKDKVKDNSETTKISPEDPSIDNLAANEKEKVEEKTSDTSSKPVDNAVPASEVVPGIEDETKAETPAKKAIPEPKALGWKEVSGFTEKDKIFPDEEIEDLNLRTTLIEDYVPSKFYGDWYHNAGIIFFSCLIAFSIAKVGGGFGWVFIPMILASIFYRTSIRKLRRVVRDSLTRECEINRIETDVESMEWLNIFLTKFWVIFEPALAVQVVTEVNKVLRDSCPKFLESIALETFTLGTKPFRIDHVRTFPKTEEDIAVMDWKVSFSPIDSVDFTSRQAKNKVDCKIVLAVRAGKGKFSMKLPIVVSKPTFSGLVRVRLRMMTTFPHIQTVDFSFLEHPKLDFDLRPVGGSLLGVDINVIPGLKSFINEMVSSIAGPMAYTPNAFHINIQQMLAGAPLDSAIGVIVVTAQNARGLKGSDGLGQTMDPYVIFSLNHREELERTNIIKKTAEPKWNENKFILVKNLNEVLTMDIFDFNEFKKDKRVGGINFNLSVLEENHIHESLTSKVMHGNKTRGEFNYDVRYFPILEGKTLDDGSQEPPPLTNTGIVRLTIHSAKDLSGGASSPYAELVVNNKSVYKTETLKHTASPVWESSYEFLVTDRAKCKVATLIKTSTMGSPIGKHAIKLQDLLDRTEDNKDWFNLSSGGRVRITAHWKSVALEDIAGSNGYTEPIGVARLHIKKALDLRNLETVGKIDPYVRVFVSGFQKGRTFAFDNELNPVWDDIVYVPIQSERQKITLEAMDVESGGKDRSLGSFDISASTLIKKNEKGEYLEYKDTKDRTNMFKMNTKSPKGTLFYNLSFFPTVPILDPEESAEKKKTEEEAAKKAEEEATKNAEEEAAENTKNNSAKKPKDKASSSVSVNDKNGDENFVDTVGKVDDEIIEPEKLDLSFDELTNFNSGVLAFNIVDAEVSETGTYVQILFDNYGYPTFSSPKIKNRKEIISETGDIIIRELDWSRVIIRLTDKSHPKDSDIISSTTIPTLNLLKKAYYQNHEILINTKSNKSTKVKLNLRYFPIRMDLDPSESINNMGSLKIDLLSADRLPSADHNGKSDPYALVELNGEKVFKTKTIKKTLSPTWNESCEIPIMSRTTSKLMIRVFDWDMGPGGDDFLGEQLLNISTLEPLEEESKELLLDGGEHGTLALRTLFKPEYIVRTLKSKGVDSLPYGVSDVAGTGVKGVGAVAGAGVKGVGAVAGVGVKGASFLKDSILHHGRKHDGSGSEDEASDNTVEGNAIDGNAIPMDPHPGSITVIGSIGFEGCHSLQVKVLISAKKEMEVIKTKAIKPTDGQCLWNESANFKAAPNNSIIIKVYDRKTFGGHTSLGENTISLSDVKTGEANMPFGNGELRLNIQYEDPNRD
ncbi:tricalbin [Nadsonia fulvescens var. elongata DSM 6958]|uniref:Tricalbin n=1 Tax=Nadsonia fulvescens var. elongata DSM 6958 TaxID=857566 RepID=A0A1E3PJP2_9ASCO|nr:tricalbin [Nadsonia fulvescens var. elongata DSM 6958]